MNAFAVVALLRPSAAESEQTRRPPSALFGELFRDVAAQNVFPDFKAFVDGVPNESPEAILSAYRSQRPQTPDALRRFVLAHFRFERPAAAPPPRAGAEIAEHIRGLWPHLIRRSQNPPRYGSALPLPRPYVVPGGRFHELYYWDSYFTMLGFGPGEDHLRRDIIANFSYELHTYGFIPNGNRTYYLSRSQPPFFFKMVALGTKGKEAQAFARFLPELKIEYAYWMRGAEQAAPGRPAQHVVKMPDGALLNRYWDARDTPRDESYPADVHAAIASRRNPRSVYRDMRAAAESGWDFSSRWFADGRSLATIQTTAIVPADLNSILFGLEKAISEGCAEARDGACAADFRKRAARRRSAMVRYLWNGAYFDDYRWTDGRQLRNRSAAVLYPLFLSVASPAQARTAAEVARIHLLKKGGLVTTTRATGQQWDSPNGWAPLQWIAVAGLRNYGENRLARRIACRWLSTVTGVYAETGRLLEKYDVVTRRPGGGGEYTLQDGFGWTNGVTLALLKQYPDCATSR